MKATKKFATKIAGIALATVIAVGGFAVNAAENGEQVFGINLGVTASRSFIFSSFDYTACTTTLTVPDTGDYRISISTDKAGEYYKEVKIYDSNGNTPLESSGPWESSMTYSGITLEAGVSYTLEVYAEDFMGYDNFLGLTTDNSGEVTFTITTTLEEKIVEEEVEPEVIEEPEVVEIPQILVAAPAPAPEPEIIEEIAPVVPSLTRDQIRVLSARNFVGHLYLEGLGRRASEDEITYWVDSLLCCRITATEAASEILTSAEFNGQNSDNEQMAARLNDVFAANTADTLAQLNDGASVQSVIEQLAGTDNWASKCAFYGVNV